MAALGNLVFYCFVALIPSGPLYYYLNGTSVGNMCGCIGVLSGLVVALGTLTILGKFAIVCDITD